MTSKICRTLECTRDAVTELWADVYAGAYIHGSDAGIVPLCQQCLLAWDATRIQNHDNIILQNVPQASS